MKISSKLNRDSSKNAAGMVGGGPVMFGNCENFIPWPVDAQTGGKIVTSRFFYFRSIAFSGINDAVNSPIVKFPSDKFSFD